jgi:hypothetical protein
VRTGIGGAVLIVRGAFCVSRAFTETNMVAAVYGIPRTCTMSTKRFSAAQRAGSGAGGEADAGALLAVRNYVKNGPS